MERYFQVDDFNWLSVDHQRCQVVWWLSWRANTAVQSALVNRAALTASMPPVLASVHANGLFGWLGFGGLFVAFGNLDHSAARAV